MEVPQLWTWGQEVYELENSCVVDVAHLVHKLLDQLKVLRADTLGAVNQKHQVDVSRLAGWREKTLD